MDALCWAPVLLAGYLMSTDFHFNASKHKSTVEDASVVSMQTCDRGWGLEAKAATNGLYGASLQYGTKFDFGSHYSVTVIPKFGVSYADHPVLELPQRTQFGLGSQVLFGYQQYRVGVELWHLMPQREEALCYAPSARVPTRRCPGGCR
jgi:hypothetical protein